MKCLACHGEDILVIAVKEELRVENNIVRVPVQIPVCRACGERYYDRRTIQFLEKMERRLREGSATLQEVGKVLELSS